MVKHFKILLFGLVLTISTIMIFNCHRRLNIPPKFRIEGNWWLRDTIRIYKNGYRMIPLDSIIEDEDDVDSLIRWSIASGSLLTIRHVRNNIFGRCVDLVPNRNQTGKTFVTFTAIDPGGLIASKTCSVFVFEPNFKMYLADSQYDTISIKVATTKRYYIDSIIKSYDRNLISSLQWFIYTDPSFLRCSLSHRNLDFIAKNIPCTTGIYFEVTDPINHVTFHHSTLVFIKSPFQIP